MNVKHIINVLRIAYHAPIKTPLGRWNIHNNTQTKLKIQYANEDNCGTSGNYSEYTEQIKENQELDELYVYMMGTESLPDTFHTKR
jgi:hypothetical protein